MACPRSAIFLRFARFPSAGLLALSLAVGCLPKIGDDCVVNNDCSQQQDRLCDTTQPGGYCTMANCEPDSCPEKESVCVAFNNTRSNVGLCDNPGLPSPHRRMFCMATCATSSQCRPGYACVDLGADDVWSAEVIEKDPRSTRVCMVAQSLPEFEEGRSDGFCSGAEGAGLAGAPGE